MTNHAFKTGESRNQASLLPARIEDYVGPDNRAPCWFSCPAPDAKILWFSEDPNHFYIRRRLVPHEGRFAIVTDAGRDAVDAAASGVTRDRRAGLMPVSDQRHARRTALMRTAKSCGPGTRCWCQVGGVASARPGADKNISVDDGGKRNSS